MNKWILGLITLSILFCCGCEDDFFKSEDDDDGLDDITALIHKEGVVAYTSEGDGAFRVYEMESHNLIVTDQTELQFQRPSCSGFDYCGPYDIHPGNYIEYTYYQADVDYSTHPESINVRSVKGYRDECLRSPSTDEPCNDCDEDPCNDCD